MEIFFSSDYEIINFTTITNISKPIVFSHQRWILTPFYVTAPLYAIIFLLSLFGNLLVILVVLRVPGMRSRTNRLLFNLSVASLLLTTLCVPFMTIESFLQSSWIFGPVWCKYKITVISFVDFQMNIQCMRFFQCLHTLNLRCFIISIPDEDFFPDACRVQCFILCQNHMMFPLDLYI